MGVLGEMPTDYAAELHRRFDCLALTGVDDAFDALVVWELDVPALVKLVEQHRALKWLHLRWAGVPRPVLQVVSEQTLLTNGSGAHGPAIAEYVIGVMMAHYKGLFAMRSAQERGEWLREFRLRELRGQSVGIIGLGDLGLSIARVLRGFGVRLRGLRRSASPCPDVDELFETSQLHDFVRGLDVLIVAAPLTPATNGLIGAAELACVQRGALLVNVGRAAIVDEGAMLDALGTGQLGGAALDVFLSEPLPADSPLWQLSNVFISPHCADASPESRERGFHILLDNIQRFLSGQSLRNVVDRTAGY